MIPALRNGGLSRRGFLRALGVTACAALVPGLVQGYPRYRSGTRYFDPAKIHYEGFPARIVDVVPPPPKSRYDPIQLMTHKMQFFDGKGWRDLVDHIDRKGRLPDLRVLCESVLDGDRAHSWTPV